ncbi:hypothetical protein [Bartonella tribocorum]|uniref:hypothetical protein n=1 Tax=Bartonella tribocorum TaxID=85701 RepID=UPI0002EF3A64|nr:hypothetical protein [Bartonella tribocorum]CDO49328.1 hypothetical protein BM1374166_01673 [Bartonella tribocorum]
MPLAQHKWISYVGGLAVWRETMQERYASYDPYQVLRVGLQHWVMAKCVMVLPACSFIKRKDGGAQ